MGGDVGQVNLDFLVRVAEDPGWARSEVKRIEAYNREHGALYDGEPVPVSIKPNFISPSQADLLERASGELMGALDAFVEVFLEDPQLQQMWNVSDEELDLYQVDPGYPGAIQVSRFDGFLEGSDLTFLEFNCDSPGGAGYADVIHEAFMRLYERNHGLGSGYRVEQTSRVTSLKETLLDAYEAWRQGADRPAEPYVVVSDWPDVASRPDIDVTVERLQRLGLDAAFADPRDLTLDGDELVHGDRRVDVLYKRVITRELMDEPEASDLLDAYRAGTVCMVNAPRSVIVGNKKIMAALRRPEIQRELTPSQRRAIDRHVPWTAVLEPGKVEVEGLKVDLRDLVLDNKDELVLKPARGYGGKGVTLGSETDDETWGTLVDEHIGADWIVQRAAKIPKELYPQLTDDGVEMAPVNVNVNPFVFGGSFAGAYTRISREKVINVSYGGGLVPTITASSAEPG